MHYLRIGSASLNQTPLDWEGNYLRIMKAINHAHANNVQILTLPELAVTGYGCDDAFFSVETLTKSEEILEKILENHPNMLSLIGLPIQVNGRLYNAAAMIYGSKILGINIKKILPREGVHYESRWFTPWASGAVAETIIANQTVDVGDIAYSIGNIGIGVEICEEAWGAANVNLPHLQKGLHVVLNPSASHFAFGKYETRKKLVSERSRAMQVVYAYSNLVGLESGRIIYDGSLLLADRGEIVRVGRRFSHGDTECIYADVDLDLVRTSQIRVRGVEDMQGHAHVRDGFRVKIPNLPEDEPTSSMDIANLPQEAPLTKNEEFLFATVLGLKDYLKKSYSKGFVISLSGGCDSSLCTYLVSQMFAMMLEEQSPEEMSKELGIPVPSSDPKLPSSWIKQCVHAVYQETEHNSDQTKAAAKELAEELGVNFHHVKIDNLIEQYTQMGQEILGRSLSWESDDLALQNIQSRVRSPLVWLIANVYNCLLLSTCNRSEAAVGYATMDGDTAGGLAPIAGVDKPFIRTFLQWAAEECSHGLGKIKSLKTVYQLEPSAELRPVGDGGVAQTDEMDLMPYVLLEAIEELLIRDKRSIDDVLRILVGRFPEFRGEELRNHINKFQTLFKRNQWKREKLAPSFHLDDESMDPKNWCRYPILSK